MGPETVKAIERGKAKQKVRRPKWEPIGVICPGWLAAQLEHKGTGTVYSVFYQNGSWQYGYGDSVRDPEMKRIAKAMVGINGETRAALLREATAERKARVAERVGEVA